MQPLSKDRGFFRCQAYAKDPRDLLLTGKFVESGKEMDQMSDEIKRVKRELKFKGKIIDFYQDTMEINGDHTVIWDFIKHKGAAAVVPVTDEGKILMVRQYRNALERYTLEIPAGALDTADEPGITCASRELEEETGYRSENLEWLINLRTTVAFCNEKIEVFVAKNLIPSKQHLDEDEFIDLGAYTMEELKEKIIPVKLRMQRRFRHCLRMK